MSGKAAKGQDGEAIGMAEALFRARLADADQHLVDGFGRPLSPQAAALYFDLDRRFAEPARCQLCLRVFEGRPTLRHRADGTVAGAARRKQFCSPTCRARAEDARLKEHRPEWRQCANCQADFWCLYPSGFGDGDGLIVCPPTTPEKYWPPRKSTCYQEFWEANKTRLNTEACARYRERKRQGIVKPRADR